MPVAAHVCQEADCLTDLTTSDDEDTFVIAITLRS